MQFFRRFDLLLGGFDFDDPVFVKVLFDERLVRRPVGLRFDRLGVRLGYDLSDHLLYELLFRSGIVQYLVDRVLVGVHLGQRLVDVGFREPIPFLRPSRFDRSHFFHQVLRPYLQAAVVILPCVFSSFAKSRESFALGLGKSVDGYVVDDCRIKYDSCERLRVLSVSLKFPDLDDVVDALLVYRELVSEIEKHRDDERFHRFVASLERLVYER